MTFERPGWHPVDPSRGSLSSVLPAAPGPGEILVIASAAGEEDRSWAARTVAAAVREWSRLVDRLLVMDLDLEGPGIDEELGAERAEGVSDLLLFGASLSRVAQPLGEGALHFVSAGTPVATTRPLLSHARWDDVIRSFRDTGATLVLHLPSGQSGAAFLVSRADRIVHLGRPGTGEDEISSDARDRIVGNLAPPEVVLEAEASPELPEEEPTETDGEGDEAFQEIELYAAAGEEGTAEAAGAVVDIADLAPDEPPAQVEAGVTDESFGSAGMSASEPSAAGNTAASRSRVVVDIADLAPDDEIVDIRELAPERPADRVGAVGFDEAGVIVDIADLAPDGPTSVPRAPDKDLQEDSFAAGLDAIDAAAASGKQAGLGDFDLEGLDAVGGEREERGEEPGVEETTDEEAPDHGEGDDEATTDLVAGTAPGDVDGRREDDEEPRHAEAEIPGLEEEPELPEEAGFPGESEAPRDSEIAEEATFDEEGFAADSPFDSDILGVEDRDEEFAGEEPAAADVEDRAAEAGSPEGGDDELVEAPEEVVVEDQGFGAFSGELDAVADEPRASKEEDVEASSTPSGAGGQEEEGAPETDGDDDFGADLVTGPDFGHESAKHESSKEDEIWEEKREEAADREAEATAGDGGDSGAASSPGRREERSEGSGAGSGERATDEAPLVGVDAGAHDSPDRTRGRPFRLLALLVVVAVGAVTGHWYDVIDVPGLNRALISILGPAGAGAAPSVDTSGPQPASPVQARSLLLNVYRDAQAAAEVALALRERLPDRVFAVSPVQAGGDVTFRLLAGPANTPQDAEALREILAGVLTREDPSEWTPEESPLAFLIDEIPGLDAAQARADAVSGAGVFAYVLRVGYPDGSTAHRVYAGAYSNAEEARALQGILAQAGIDDATFTERRGEVPE